jgi:hypothetical protein
MKRILPYAIVTLAVLVSAGVVVAAKNAKTKKAADTKVAHRSSKQKAANEKLVQELLTIMEETENKTTFAACVECLMELKPQRDVVVPAIIRKADKMGWLKADSPETAMIGDCLFAFLPQKKHQQTYGPGDYVYRCPPYPAPLPPPPWPPQAMAPPAPCQSIPIAAPPCADFCPSPAVAPNPMPCCGTARNVMASTFGIASGTCANPVYVSVTQAPAQDKLMNELLKILDETESKVTFAIVVETLAERCENWDAVIPAIIRKADRMGWLKVADKDFADKFTENLVEVIMNKAKMPERNVAPLPTPCESYGCPMPCPAPCPKGAGLRLTVPMTLCDPCCTVEYPIPVLTYPSVERLPMPHSNTEKLPMPHGNTEVLPMPSEPHGNSGYLLNECPSDPTQHVWMLMNQSEDLRQMQWEWLHFWMVDHPSHLTYDRIDGGLQ